MSAKYVNGSEQLEEPQPSWLQRAADFIDRLAAVLLVAGNLVLVLLASSAGAAQCAATAFFVDEPPHLAGVTAVAATSCHISPGIRALLALSVGNTLYIAGIFASRTPVHRHWRWLRRGKRVEAMAKSATSTPAANDQVDANRI